MTLPTLYIPHGGGPCFFMEPIPGFPPDTWDKMAAYLRGIPATLPRRPKAILVISAHWECEQATVLSASQHSLLYDYYGFPEHTYQLTYPAQGSPELAARVRDLLASAGISTEEEHERGLDHGVFIPFKLIYPEADLPIVQLSLLHNLDPAQHLAIGHALAPLRNEGVLIVGSGMSYHNLRELFIPDAGNEASRNFDDWLGNAVTAETDERERLLTDWRQAPDARICHPRSEHLIPLMVVAGAAGKDAGHIDYRDTIMGKQVSAYRFGAARLP
ncbi:MAG TPA: class III extradiol ring-cleavage dioxygenase [Sideroxyarcus sp.]|nr:class III extradiol ring-cleavage dioxygenase [Sideroxyarcus sp.]